MRVASFEFRVSSCKLRIARYELPLETLQVASCKLRAARCELRVASCELKVAMWESVNVILARYIASLVKKARLKLVEWSKSWYAVLDSLRSNLSRRKHQSICVQADKKKQYNNIRIGASLVSIFWNLFSFKIRFCSLTKYLTITFFLNLTVTY